MGNKPPKRIEASLDVSGWGGVLLEGATVAFGGGVFLFAELGVGGRFCVDAAEYERLLTTLDP